MSFNNDKVKIVFGLKIKQLRLDQKLSPAEVSLRSGLSVSYLNEIEKGKKYPKTDKIFALATALNVQYDELVSLKLNQKLEPITELLNTNLLADLPLHIFGIEPVDFIELLSDTPTQISAFINMLAEISRNHGINKVDFYYSVLRAYQEMNDNYFDSLEKSVENFRKIFEINKITSPNATLLEDILTNFYSIKTKHFPEQHQEIDNLIAGFSAKNKTLFINPKATEEEKAFVFAREIAFMFLQLKERSYSEPALEVKSFNQILNDYKASYWAAALLINKDILTDRLTYFFASPRWDSHTLLTIMQLFKASPEVFFNRMSGLMTNHFKVNNFLLMVISKNIDLPIYELTKELQFSYLPTTNETKQMEHYCRRWVSLKILDQPISFFQNKNTPICGAQISIYENLNKNYLMFSMTNFSEINNLKHTSSSIGFEIDDNLKTVINFLNDPLLKTVQVNQTCERCNIADCNERVVPASTLNKNEVIKRKIQVLKSIIE